MSTLVANGQWLFALSDDSRTVFRAAIDAPNNWRAFAKAPAAVTALSTFEDYLYFAGDGSPALGRIRISDGQVEPQACDLCSFSHPSSIAVLARRLYVADRTRLLSIDRNTGSYIEVDLAGAGLSVPSLLAAGDGYIVAASTSSGDIYEVDGAGQPSVLCTTGSAECRVPSGLPLDVIPWTQVPKPYPVALQVKDGIIYFVDNANFQLFAVSRFGKRPARLPYNMDHSVIHELAATETELITRGGSNTLRVYPRPVLAEVRFDSSLTSKAMAKFYSYLYDNHLLPTKSVEMEKTLYSTLRTNHILLSPEVGDDLEELICKLNPRLCKGDTFKPALAGEHVTVPDVYAESYIDVLGVTLTGSTLMHKAQKTVKSPEFRQWTTADYLLKLNPLASVNGYDDRTLLLQKKGTFNVPVEQVRFVAAVPLKQLRDPKSRLWKVVQSISGVRMISLEEIPSTKGGVFQGQTTLPDADNHVLADAYQHLLRTIKYKRSSGVRTAYVGVADNDIDCSGPDLGADACENSVNEINPVPSSASVRNAIPTATIRDFADQDHGTSVAALIAARHTAFGGTGLAAPDAIIVPVISKEPAIGDSIRRAFLSGVRTFNLSFQFPDNTIPTSLYAAIKKYGSALFVVSAGNSVKDEELCSPNMLIYPACWGTLPNVLTVGAATDNGEALLPQRLLNGKRTPGSNWSPTFVGVVAPGEGFYSSARGGGYVPVAGTSFAAPIATATAALLNAQGIIEPWLVKQRIISTSDFGLNLKGKSIGGLINVDRALSSPYRAVLTDDNLHTSIVELVATEIVVRLDQSSRTIPLSSVRRLIRNSSGSYKLLFVEAGSEDLTILDDVSPQAWPFKYFECDPVTGATRGTALPADLSTFTDFVGPIK